MEIKQLRTFIAVADSKSFLKAAESLYISRQAITKTIDQLEEELGVELFFRTQKGAMMTPAGIYFYPRAASIISDMDKLKAETLEMKRQYMPKVKVCMSFGIYDHYATKLHNYRVEHSQEVSISLRGCLDADAATILGDHRADAVLSFTPPSDNFAKTIEISTSPIMLMVTRNDAANREVGINQLPKLLYNGGFEYPIWWDMKVGKHDIISSDISYLYSLLMSGKGVMPMPKIALPTYFDSVMTLPCYPAPTPRPIYYSTLKEDHYNALTMAFLGDILQNVILENND